jgi:hypothetical protein
VWSLKMEGRSLLSPTADPHFTPDPERGSVWGEQTLLEAALAYG